MRELWGIGMSLIKKLFAGLIASTVLIAWAQTESEDATQGESQSVGVSLPNYEYLERITNFRGPYTDQDDPVLLKAQQKEADRTGVDPREFVCRPPHCSRDESRLIIKLATPGAVAKRKSQNFGIQSSDLLDSAALTPIFKPQAVAKAVSKYNQTNSAMPMNSLGKRVDLSRWNTLRLPKGVDIDQAIAELELDPRVEVVESDFERQLKGSESKPADGSGVASPMVTANDPRVSEQWALGRTRTEEAWQWLEDNGYPAWGDRNIVVAVIDSGVDYTHEDLAGNMWINAGEIPDNNIDDDNNGFIDDVYGADVVGQEGQDHDGDPQDDNGHGTHVAGIIAAQGDNGIGIIGVAPNAQIMAIKAAQYSGALTSTDIAEGILYAYQQGADIINMSFGGPGRSVLEEEALAVAFSNAVLIAAAGNQGAYNDLNCGPRPRPSYPAAYPYVLGVMAEAQTPNQKGDWLAGFSNWDCKPKNGLEYEVMAPGVDILSTIPGDGYAAWDGTSMAAPVAAGMAALVRTRFNDKTVYSSRFIMGQLASTGDIKQSITPCTTCDPLSNFSADTLQALLNTPKPSLAYFSHFLWDEADVSSKNDDDGIVDSGETIEVGLTIKNLWGQADNVVVTLSAQAPLGEGVDIADPYVTFNSDTVSYGSTGSFAQDDNGYIYENNLLVGVDAPFSFTVAENTPNEHIIPMLVSITATNGLDTIDATVYEFESRFSLIVQSGRELPRIIDSDIAGTPGGDIDTDGVENGVVTIDDTVLWLIDNPVLVSEGTTLKVGPGAKLQFWGTQPDDAYAVFENSYLQIEGSLEVEGSADKPATLKPSDLFPSRGVVIDNRGRVSITYADIYNLSGQYYDVPGVENRPFESIDHSQLSRLDPQNSIVIHRTAGGSYWSNSSISFAAKTISNTKMSRLALEYKYARYEDGLLKSGSTANFAVSTQPQEFRMTPAWADVSTTLIENTAMGGTYPKSLEGSVFLTPNQQYANASGDTVTVGSRLQLGGYQTTELQIVADVFQYEDKSYVLLWKGHPEMPGYENNFDKHLRQIETSREFAQSLNGDLVVYSSDAEQTTLADHYKTFWDAAVSVEALSNVTDVCSDFPEICEKIVDDKFDWWYGVVIGIANINGQWGWITGESPSLSADPLNRSLPDPSLERVPYLFQGLGSLSSNYTQTIGRWADLPFVLLEIPGAYTRAEMQAEVKSWQEESTPLPSVTSTAVLNPLWDANPSNWLVSASLDKFDLSDTFGVRNDLNNVYWGTDNPAVIEFALKGNARDFNKLPIDSQPMALTAPETAYPFVASVKISDGDGSTRPGNVFSAEATIWDVTFNRDMDTAIQPMVTYGPDVPYTDFTVSGDWIDARTWRGQANISPVATDGYQYVRVAGAVAADDPWLVTGDDKRRFRFEVITSGTESLNLQASGGEGYVDLSWNQDDYDTLMGFNIYRSTTAENGFVRINQTLVGNEDRSFRDDSTEPGVQYFYYFTVALDGSESEPSNVASATPIDTVKPQMSHDVISATTFGSTVLIQAEVTDNIAVQEVTLYYRAIGTTAYTSVAMANTSGNTYRASIPASATLPPGVEYYIAATDGASYTYSGRASSPNTISVDNSPVITSVVPSAGSAAGGESVIVSGNNFAEGASVTLGGATCQNVVVESASRISCVTPASAPNLVAVSVTNPDGGSGTLTSAYTFVGNSTSLALPDVEAQKGQTLDVALTVGAVSSLQSFSATITWNSSHLQLANVVKGPLVSGWELEYSESTVDASIRSVTIAAGSGTRVSGSGALALLEFVVVAEGEVSSALTITSAQMNEGTIEVDVQDGSFSVAPGYGISGSVRFWDTSGTPVEATVTLDGTDEVITSPTTGAYSFAGLLDAQHDVTVAKDDGVNESIRLYDASLVLSHVVGVAPLSGPALIAADTSGNGSVTEQDAAQILEVAAGLRGLPFVNQASPWQFSPPEYSYDSLTSDITNADFTAIFTGDVSGNWAGVGLQSVSGLRTELESISREGVAKVKLYVTPPNLEQAVSALELGFDTTTGVSLLEVTRGELLASWREPMVSVEDSVYGNYFKVSLYDDLRGAFSTEVHALTLTLSLANGEQVLAGVSGWVNEYQSANFETLVLRMPDDNDGDFVPNAEDAFPDDVAASVDTDGDGMPDDWNEGYGATDSSTGLVVDPDDDGDGYSDIEELSEGSDPLDSDDQPAIRRMSPGILRTIIELYRS